MLEKEFQYYLDNQEKLTKEYCNMYVVIVGQKIINCYKTNEIALRETKKDYPLGTFLIQHCTPGDSAYTCTFYSNVKI